MAAKAHVQDSTVAERRLRPIYEWLDSGNSKKALQEAEKVLKKTPNLQCAKALKALALLQLGREPESINILNALTAEIPSDNLTLQAMTVCYRDLQQLDKVCSLYKAAVEADPSNEELHTHLFMSYVRTSNFQMQQQAAMTLYKLKPKNPYYFWAVMSIVLQATRGQGANDPVKRKVLLALAERMVEKLITENRIEAEQEVQLYLMILELEEKFKFALQVLDSPLGTKLMNSPNGQVRIPFLVKLNKWKEINLLCKEILTANVDRWDVWQQYLQSVFEIYKSKSSENLNNHTSENHENSSEIAADDNPEKAHEFICSLMENVDNLFTSSASYQLRGPYLARFELCDKMAKCELDPKTILGDIFELFVEYFRIFGHKPCCVSDLRIYLHLLEPQRRKELAARLLKDVGISSTTLPQTENQMQRHICSLQLSRICGSHSDLDNEYLKVLITALSLHYQNGAQSFGKDRLPTDQSPADPYALLAAHALYDQAIATKSSSPILTALVLLEGLLKKSPSNFHAKLLCVRLYNLLGGGEGAQKMYESLDIKHLQLDSLGFVHCSRHQCTGLSPIYTNHYDTLKFFTTNYRDSIDHLTFSYKFGSFLKLEEFMDFRERLNNSLHFTITAVDRMITEMMLCQNIKGLDNIEASPKNNNIDWDKVRDNNDYAVYLSWDPERIENTLDKSPYVQTLFKQEKEVARIRTTIIWGMTSASEILKSTEENREQTIKVLSDVITSYKDIFDTINSKINEDFKPLNHTKISVPLPSRLQLHLIVPYRDILGTLFKVVHGIASGTVEGIEKALEICKIATTKMTKDLNCMITEYNEKEDKLWKKYEKMEHVVNVVEVVCLSSLLCAICAEFTKPAQQKKGKKNKNTPTNNVIRDNLMKFIKELKTNVTNIEKIISGWEALKDPSDLSQRLGAISISTEDQVSSVLDNINSSHISAINQLKIILYCKIKYLNQLIC